MCQSRVSCFERQLNAGKQYRAAASLHSHTHHSKEALQFIPQFAEKYPLLNWALKHKCGRSAIPVDFARAYWTPPLSAEMSLQLEKGQIENTLGLASFVSLTDHDCIEAPLLLRALPDTKQTPISLEWSVPYSDTVFHLGVHNLPEGSAQAIAADLATYTKDPCEERLTELLAALDELPDVLIIFNHPLWDLREVGQERHEQAIQQFMQSGGRFLHAIEINATRGWSENDRVRAMAERLQLPSISGGDRHGCDASSALNLTNAETFQEFVHEIRREQRSHVLMMPQYAEPRCMRLIQMLLDVIRDYPDHPIGTRRWDNRVFHPGRENGLDRPISALWKAPPAFIEVIFSTLRLLENATVKHALKQTMPGEAVDRAATDMSYESYEATL
jgi:hypothetical protein